MTFGENEPDIDHELLSGVHIATPHIAGYSADGKANGTAMIVNFLTQHFKLPQDNWFPSDVPEPENPVIRINCSGKSDEDVLREAIMHTYDISNDDKRLREALSDFEKQRAEYPIRREFRSYKVIPDGGSPSVISSLKEIGFNI